MKNVSLSYALLSTFLFCFAARQTHAGLFVIKDRAYGGASDEQKALADQALNALETEMNKKLPPTDASSYLKGIANATSIAGAGMGATYGATFKYGLLGVSAGVGLDTGKKKFGDVLSGETKLEQIPGFAAQAAVLAGIDGKVVFKDETKWFGFFYPGRSKLFFSFMSYNTKQDIADIGFMNFGLMGQYKLVPELYAGYKSVKWGGVDVTSGLRYSSMKASITKKESVTTTQDLGAPFGTATVKFDGTLKVGADVGIFSIPVEVSTSVRLLYIWLTTVGLGTDFNFGKAKANASVEGPVAFTSAGPTITGTGSLNLGQDAGPSFVNLRGFLGQGIEFGVGTLYVAVNKSFINSTIGANLGFNMFW